MTEVNELDEGQLRALEKVEKLLRLAAKNPNPEEAAFAAAKAQELLVAYNLSAEVVGQGSGSDAVREQQKLLGGMYKYQRYLWRAVAELNFCLHFVHQKYTERRARHRDWDGTWVYEMVPYMRHQHTIVGRRVNARATVAMGQYLEQTIERLVKEQYPLNSQRFMSEAVALREGIADEVYWRLVEKRRKLIEEEEERRRRDAAAAGVSTSQALTIGSLAEQERDANLDHIHGEGYSARQRAARAERAEQQRLAEESYTRWAQENPEEAARLEKERRKDEERAVRRSRSGGAGSRGGQTAQEKRQGMSSYWRGREIGKRVGLDAQAGERQTETRRLT